MSIIRLDANDLERQIHYLNAPRDSYAVYPETSLHKTCQGKYYLKFLHSNGTITQQGAMTCKECFMFLDGMLRDRKYAEEILLKHQVGKQKQRDEIIALHAERADLKKEMEWHSHYRESHGNALEFYEQLMGKIRTKLPYEMYCMNDSELDAALDMEIAMNKLKSAEEVVARLKAEMKTLTPPEPTYDRLTYNAFIAAGWTDDLLLSAEGGKYAFLVPVKK